MWGSALDARHLDFGNIGLADVFHQVGIGGSSVPSTIIPHGTPVAAAVERLYSQGLLAVLYAPWGSQVRGYLSSWRKGGVKAGSAGGKTGEAGDEADLVLDGEEDAETPGLSNPEWIRFEEAAGSSSTESTATTAQLEETVWCKVDTQGMMPGDQLMFHISVKARDGKADLKLETLVGHVGQGRSDDAAMVKVVIPKSKQGREFVAGKDSLTFVARSNAHKLEAKGPDLKLGASALVVWLGIDTDDPKAKDDILILKDEGGAEVMRLNVAEMEEVDADYVELRFPGLVEDVKYTLIRDYGKEEDGGQDALFEDMTPAELREWGEGTA